MRSGRGAANHPLLLLLPDVPPPQLERRLLPRTLHVQLHLVLLHPNHVSCIRDFAGSGGETFLLGAVTPFFLAHALLWKGVANPPQVSLPLGALHLPSPQNLKSFHPLFL